MISPYPLIALGLLVLVGNILKRIFILKKIPDILPLIIIGIIAGPVLGLLSPSDLGIIGPIFALATLVIILFQGGISLKIDEIIGSLRGAALLSVCTFFFTVIISAGLIMIFFGFDRFSALLFGCIIGGTSSAVVFPLIRDLSIHPSTHTILMIESALTDVICIVTVLSLLDITQNNVFNISTILVKLSSTFFIAIGTGITGGLLWVLLRDKIRSFETYFTVPALVCILYGCTELMFGSGAIAVLIFGIVLGNSHLIDNLKIKGLPENSISHLTQTEVDFFSQVVDLLKTFFFIYVGLSLTFASPLVIGFCVLLIILLHIFRIPSVIITIKKQIPEKERWVVIGMIPKGLAAAVLASLPLQYGLPFGEQTEIITYTVIIVSIISTSVITYICEKQNSTGNNHDMAISEKRLID